jgi:hypothetical protein
MLISPITTRGRVQKEQERRKGEWSKRKEERNRTNACGAMEDMESTDCSSQDKENCGCGK